MRQPDQQAALDNHLALSLEQLVLGNVQHSNTGDNEGFQMPLRQKIRMYVEHTQLSLQYNSHLLY